MKQSKLTGIFLGLSLAACLLFSSAKDVCAEEIYYFSEENFKETNYSSGGCVAWARDRVMELLGFRLPSTGNQPSGVYGASNWWYNLDYPRGETPAVHALAIWSGGRGKNGKYGHVAFVEDVGTTTIGGVTVPLISLSEGGFSSEENGVKYGSYTSMNRTSSGYDFLGYVYVDEAYVPADASYEKPAYPSDEDTPSAEEPVYPSNEDTPSAEEPVLDEDSSIKTAMYRLYNPNSGEHFYTANALEKDHLDEIGWDYEGIAWYAPDTSTVPVYRLYNPNSGEHHYTINTVERDSLVDKGWRAEGIGWYSDDSKTTEVSEEKIGEEPLYRLYNPNAKGQMEPGAHHYTKDVTERDNLIKIGWSYEGIGWYGCL